MLYFCWSNFCGDFGKRTPAVILGLQLHEAEAPEEGALFKPGEFGEGFFSKSIARFWRPVRILVN